MGLVIPLSVAKQVKGLPKADQARLVKRLETIAMAPEARHPGTTEMVGQPGVWRVRQGDWRAVYEIVEGHVIVARVGHRREVYE